MKVTVPNYYKNFKCIDALCEDTCCAGWEVEVDREKFSFYKKTGGKLGERLKEVMIPMEDNEGCFFRLKEDKRCPFLNNSNLCDIYTELGEEALCETCTDFPRFKNVYGAIKEIGLAPSCFTAAQLMVNAQCPACLESFNDGDMSIVPNDIDPEDFIKLKTARETIFSYLWEKEESGKYRPLKETILKILKLTRKLQEELTGSSTVHEDRKYVISGADEDITAMYLRSFDGMELINKDWLKAVRTSEEFLKKCPPGTGYEKKYNDFGGHVKEEDMAFRQLFFYYIYRFFLESVYDLEPLNAIKTGIVAYMCCKRLCVALYYSKGGITPDEIADIFHLYSRQLEHSQTNFEYYTSEYRNNPLYSCATLESML